MLGYTAKFKQCKQLLYTSARNWIDYFLLVGHASNRSRFLRKLTATLVAQVRQDEMATKPTKKKGETSTTVSVGIRIDPKIKFALDIMGREQKRSLTAVIEWAISNAIAQQAVPNSNYSFSDLIDKVWSTDESTRFVKLALYMPQALTYDELRVWETIKASPFFWNTYPDGTYDTTEDSINYGWVRMGWSSLIEFVEKNKNSPTIKPLDDADIIPF